MRLAIGIALVRGLINHAVVVYDWLLGAGVWDDTGVWRDAATWNDGV